MHASTAYVSVVMGSNYVTSAGSTAVAGIVFGVLLCLFVYYDVTTFASTATMWKTVAAVASKLSE